MHTKFELPPGSLLAPSDLPPSPCLAVIAAAHAARQEMLALAAHLARRGPLRVFDGGNRFNAYSVARHLRSLNVPHISSVLEHIRFARAFTCYQMTALLEEASALPLPTLVIDLLNTFYDESAPLEERRRLARRCAQRLRHLAHCATVVVSLRPPQPPAQDATGLQQIIEAAATKVWRQATPPISPPPRLF